MKTKLFVLLTALSVPAISTAQTCAQWVVQGRTNLAAQNIAQANLCFSNAVANCPNQADANVFYAATRLLVLPGQTPIDGFLTSLGFASTGRDLYKWTAQPTKDAKGHVVVPDNVNASNAPALFRTNVLPQITAAAANLAMVTDTNFTLALTTNDTDLEAVTMDYGDVVLIRAMLHASECLGYTVSSWNSDIQLRTIQTLLTNKSAGMQALLAQNPNLLTFATTNDLNAAKAAFVNAVDDYMVASQFIRNRPVTVTRLFNYDVEMASSELKFRETLQDLNNSLTNPVVWSVDTNYTFHLAGEFDGSHPPRGFLPAFTNNLIVLGTLPDLTFGGSVTGVSMQQVDNFLAKHFQVKGPDASAWLVAKGQVYTQTNSGAPVLLATNGYQFYAEVQMWTNDSVTSAQLKLPGGSTIALQGETSYDPDTGDSVTNLLDFANAFSSQVSLDGAYPNGAYQFTLSCVNDGLRTVTLNLTNNAYPPTPHISNFDAAQFLQPANDFTLTWDALPASDAHDFVQLTIMDEYGDQVYQTPNFWEDGSLSGAAVSATIPAGTLGAAQTYTAKLLFAKKTDGDTNSFPAGVGAASYYKQVQFSLGTTDLGWISIVKGAFLNQSDSSAPSLSSPKSSGSFYFQAYVNANNGSSTVTNISLRLPNGSVDSTSASGYLSTRTSFDSKAALDAAYPDGTYTLTINSTLVGTKTVTVQLDSSNTSVPHISNYAAAQAIDGTKAFTLTWDAFAGSTSADSIQVSAEDDTYYNLILGDSYGNPLTLAATATSITIPADTMYSGDTGDGTLTFVNAATASSGYPGISSYGGYYKQTSFQFFATRGIPTPDLLATNLTWSPGAGAFPGEQIQVSVTVSNVGLAKASDWYADFYFSTNTKSGSRIRSAEAQGSGKLAPGQGGTLTAQITLPSSIAGNLYLIADAWTDDFEPNTDNNTILIALIGPDLVPTAFTAPASAQAGQSVQISYTVQNQGSALPASYWSDTVYLSTNTVWDSSAIALGGFSGKGYRSLAGGASYSVTNTVWLPPSPSGACYLILRVDDSHTVVEENETNNDRAVAILLTNRICGDTTSLVASGTAFLLSNQDPDSGSWNLWGLSWSRNWHGLAGTD